MRITRFSWKVSRRYRLCSCATWRSPELPSHMGRKEIVDAYSGLVRTSLTSRLDHLVETKHALLEVLALPT